MTSTGMQNDPNRRFQPTIDTELDFVSDELRQLLDYWRRIADGKPLPSRADLEPTDIPALLPYIALIDVEDAPRRFRWRLIGTHLTRALGYDNTGQYFDEAYSGQALLDLMDIYEQVVQTGEPIRHYGQPTFADKVYAEYESTHLPLSANGESVDMILVGLVFLTP